MQLLFAFFCVLLVATVSAQSCQRFTSSSQCVTNSGCGWCGLNYTTGGCVTAKSDGSGPANGQCPYYWDNSKNCMYNGRSSPSQCSAYNCGWCGANFTSGVCLPVNATKTGPVGAMCYLYWDTQGCMYNGRNSPSTCSSYNCGWCGVNYTTGVCLPMNSSKSGPLAGICSAYWDSQGCMYNGRNSPSTCSSYNCGWCGVNYTSGVCLPLNGTKTGPLGGTCTAYWDNQGCMYNGRTSPASCNNYGCGWCGINMTSGVCLPVNSTKTGPLVGNCSMYWDAQGCMSNGRTESTCNTYSYCGWCGNTSSVGVCIPSRGKSPSGNCFALWDPANCLTKGSTFTSCFRDSTCSGWCTSYPPSVKNGGCVAGTEYGPTVPQSQDACAIYDGTGCSAVTTEFSCNTNPPCKWCVPRFGGAPFCISSVGYNNATLRLCA